MTEYKDIFDYIKQQEAAMSTPIDINGWPWNFKDHVKQSFYYKHGRLLNGNDDDTPVKNITRPLLNLQYRAEDIDVKDIVVYVDDVDSYHLSFLVKKYHDDVFVVENDLDTFFDEVKESKIDYGGGLVKEMSGARPEVIDLQSIAFCDQTDMMSGPIGIKHFYSPSQLKEMEKVGWGSQANGATHSVDELIALCKEKKDAKQLDVNSGVQNQTPGRYIEVYEVHNIPKSLVENTEDYTNQFYIVAFYQTDKNEKEGVVLFRKEQKRLPLKLHLRDKVFSRALGFGGAEEIFENQAWTNFDVQTRKDMLYAASKTILKTTDPTLAQKHPHGLKDMDNLEVLELTAGTDAAQLDTYPRNINLFIQDLDDWWTHGQITASANDPVLGVEAPSGTPFRAQERQIIEGKGLHEYRRGKFAKFIEEIYQDWIIPHIAKEITNGTTFLSELSMDEMQYVADCLVRNKANEFIKERILNGELINEEEVEAYKQQVREQVSRQGNKFFIKILKDEFNKKPLRVKVNVKGKQKDMVGVTDKIVNLIRFVMTTYDPNTKTFAALEDQRIAKLVNKAIEYSNLDPIDFGGYKPKPAALPVPSQEVAVA